MPQALRPATGRARTGVRSAPGPSSWRRSQPCRNGIWQRGRPLSPATTTRRAAKNDDCGSGHHPPGALSRTPRPPPSLTALSAISSMPASSSAATSFISESTFPRMTPSLPPCAEWSAATARTGRRVSAGRCREARGGAELPAGDHLCVRTAAFRI